MCGAGLRVRCWGAVLVSRSGRVGRGRAEWGGCLRWFGQRFCWRKSKVLVELRGAGLAAVAVNRAALIRELARMDFLTIWDQVFAVDCPGSA